jgi:flavorubredoxin
MSNKPTELFNDGDHVCLSFTDLVSGDGIQANQFLIMHGKHAALIDPGGDLTYNALNVAVGKRILIKDLDYVFASHQDPDIITSLGRWLLNTDTTVVTSKLWARFLPHLLSDYKTSQMKQRFIERILALPDEGMVIPFGDSELIALPAHFLHSVGNFQFYDPVSRILFSGDMGASVLPDDDCSPVTDFEAHVRFMDGFHRRYMCANKVCRLWASMVRSLDVEMIVPQHGRPFQGKAMVNRFLDWISELQCGVDLMTSSHYSRPTALARQAY